MLCVTTPVRLIRFAGETVAHEEDLLVTEAPLEIRIGNTPLAVLMRTPGDDRDLVLGFALTEGIVSSPSEIETIRRLDGHPEDARWELVPAEGFTVDPEQFRRNTYSTSSCGVCGKASIDAVRVAAPELPEGPLVSADVLLSLPGRLRDTQATFAATGGLHAAGAFEPGGRLVGVREDIGRHNAVDKLVGALAGEGWPLDPLVLMVSGRVSFEIVQKAAVARIPFVSGVSAASSLAVELANELGLTLIGFLRQGTFNVYTGEQRLLGF